MLMKSNGVSAPGLTGRKQRMKNPYEEGVAIHSAPSLALCAANRRSQRRTPARRFGSASLRKNRRPQKVEALHVLFRHGTFA